MPKFWNFLDHGDTAELQLFGEIRSEEDWWSDDCVTYQNFIHDLNALGNKKNINVMIQSNGGDVFAATAIYNALIANKATINGTIIGICASAATIVLMACENRTIAKNAILMVHNPTISLWGSYKTEELLKLAEVTEQVKKSIVTAYMERLDKTEEEINQLMDEESWYVGQEAVDAGFCDSILESNFQNSISNTFTENGISYSFQNYMEKFVPNEIQKKVKELSGVKKGSSFFNTVNQTKKGKKNMEETIITDVAALQAAYPQLCEQMVTDAICAERKRLKAIDEIAKGIPEDVLMKARYDEPISAEELAFAQMKANHAKGQETLNNMIEEMQNSGTSGIGSEPNTGYDTTQQQQEETIKKVAGFADKLKADKRRG